MEYTKGEAGQNDTMKLRTTLFIKFEDYTNKTVHDFTIMPVEMETITNISLVDTEDGR